jgi:hypothetical protein
MLVCPYVLRTAIIVRVLQPAVGFASVENPDSNSETEH